MWPELVVDGSARECIGFLSGFLGLGGGIALRWLFAGLILLTVLAIA